MGDWGDDGIRDDALVLLTEVVANGVSHAGSAMRVQLSLTRELLRAEVSDDNPLAPQRRVPDESGGRGVLLLDAFASQWGVTPHPGDGKTVWFELSPSALP
jgi:serine/threonine-protein kinase RsbW